MKKLLMVLLTVLFSSYLFSQVGINTETPNTKTLLHISERNKTTDPVQSKGIILPRLTEAERDAIAPAATENSLMIYNTSEDCYNYWNNEEGEWKSVCGNMGNAKFTFDCGNNIQVKGTYIKESELTESNYISIQIVNVTKPGSYTIIATPNNDNGYSFVGQGVFTATGTQTVKLYGQGIPVNAQIDDFTITSSGSTDTCATQVTVNTNVASYSLNCASIMVNGTYLKGTPLTSSNVITLNVTVSTVGSYHISTPVVNGISFAASGTFTAPGTYPITLVGSGTPTTNSNFNIEVTSNTVGGQASCTAVVSVTLPPMTYAIIGTGDYSWASSQRLAALNSSTNFGTNGTVKIVSLTQLWSTTNAATALNNLTSATMAKPDIILYFSYGAAPTTALSTELNNYVNNGGVLIYGTTDSNYAQANIMLNGIFGVNTAQNQIAGTQGDDNAYPINNLQDDEIVNGPFGNTAGKYWGEDNGSTGSVIVSQLPPNSIQIASAANSAGKPTVDPEYSIVWYNNSKNFVFFGDSVASTASSTDQRGWPSIYNSGIPKTKYYGYTPQYVYNAILEMNSVAWAIKKAAVAGINPH
ncbi:autotransporter outer membrane beta-barrel domain-containing protein [Chryseobacterium sp. CT-SW4]|uniref:hypothetical protein n=1 Tax=Chryseobacterium sp. SW-1 TaxID=3157343 RepID=UPI003B012934